MHVPPPDHVFGALGPSLAVAAAAASLARLLGGSRALRLAFAAAGAGAVFLPLDGLPLHGWFRGVAGDLSVTTLLLLLAAAAGAPRIRNADRACLLAGVVFAGLALYPAAAGGTPGDIYRFGWRPFGLVCGVVAASVAAWGAGRRFAALVPLLGLAAFDLGLFESRNLWDYLLDPPLFLYAAGWWVWRAARAAWRRAHPEKH